MATTWSSGNDRQTAWGNEVVPFTTATYAYPIGITLVFTHDVMIVNNYPTRGNMSWRRQTNTQTAWRA